MKSLVVLVTLLTSSFALSNTLEATRALESLLRFGRYSGIELKTQKKCSLGLTSVPEGTVMTLVSGDREIEHLVAESSMYQLKPGQRFFLSSTFERNGRFTQESVFRTIAINDTTQYVVGSKIKTQDGITTLNKTIECAIDL